MTDMIASRATDGPTDRPTESLNSVAAVSTEDINNNQEGAWFPTRLIVTHSLMIRDSRGWLPTESEAPSSPGILVRGSNLHLRRQWRMADVDDLVTVRLGLWQWTQWTGRLLSTAIGERIQRAQKVAFVPDFAVFGFRRRRWPAKVTRDSRKTARDWVTSTSDIGAD
ncbi:hypothetical protein THAOC_26300 [Thalassiosira oceanica]|uniref:Uncharacterized protein n=1 Tax=Thalassiosira oceanica TaxID=159749 RepID=K0S5I8_THAOC|nr:hypothetical protein THAOC_26300 [Thalassiosira oceanica]|eukprot:EJK54137.1 hypothetical protein THAOC_26300 [Thalassiosira oceanica]